MPVIDWQKVLQRIIPIISPSVKIAGRKLFSVKAITVIISSSWPSGAENAVLKYGPIA